MRVLGLAILSTLALSQIAHAETVSWYRAHPDVRDRVFRLCMDDPGHGKNTPACLNAQTAIEQATVDRIPVLTEAQMCAQYPEQYARLVLHCPGAPR